MTTALLESLHRLGSYIETRRNIILSPALPCGNVPHYLWLSVGISRGSAQSMTLTSWLLTCSPAGVYAGSSATQPPVILWPEHCPGERDTHSWLPPPQGGRAGGTVQCHLLCQDRGEVGLCCFTGRIRAADSGADGDLAQWHCKPKSLGCELKLDCGHTTLSSTMVLSCRKVCAPLIDTGKNNGKWEAVTLPQPPSYRENRIKYNNFLWRMKVNWKPSALFLIVYIEVYNCESPLYALKLIKTWYMKILLRKTQINFMVTIALWKERKRKREREKTAWFLILEISNLSHLISDIAAASINKFSFK